MLGWRLTFGLIGVVREMQQRQVTEKARSPGAITRRNGLPNEHDLGGSISVQTLRQECHEVSLDPGYYHRRQTALSRKIGISCRVNLQKLAMPPGGKAIMMIDTEEFGRVEVTDIRMPDFARDVSTTYTYSGKVFVLYRTDQDPREKDYYNIAVVNDDGTDFRTIFSGVIAQHAKANGIRHMPFQDNRRVLLGDYVLECHPDIDTCATAVLVPVEYPWEIQHDPRTSHYWSEIIIAPDNQHMAWTILRTDIGAANVMGRLTRKGDTYIIEDPQIISTLSYFEADRSNEGFIIPQELRGGEVKQFVHGGTAISLVGAKNGALPDSVVQDLITGEVTQITTTPGYDETTIFSPDECLGIVMSTRGSRKTDPAIFGVMPRPHSHLMAMGLSQVIYMYAVSGVRSFRAGNIGPVLIDIKRSQNEAGYQGVLLNNSDEAWVYVSPMSWHPGGKKAMWLEMLRGSEQFEGGRAMRVRKVVLHDYQPQATVPVQQTPDEIPYGIKGSQGKTALWNPPSQAIAGKIAAKHSGYIDYTRHAPDYAQNNAGSVSSTYVDYSNDGTTFYNGFEHITNSFTGETVYEANVEMRGEHQGEIKFRATFSRMSYDTLPQLLFNEAEDGRPKSYGFAKYRDVVLSIGDMAE